MISVLHAKLAVGIVGNVATLSTSLAPIPTFWRICTKKSTEDFSVLPYAMAFACNLLWGWYALPLITRNNELLLTICVAQVALQFIYIALYFLFTGRYQKMKLLLVMLIIALIFAVDAVTSLKLLDTARGRIFAGSTATAASLITFASPLSIMGLVIKTRSVEYMPFLVSLSLLFNCFTWTVYGILGQDLFLTIAEALGVALALGQLALYLVYYNAKPPVHVEETLEDGSSKHLEIISQPEKEQHLEIISQPEKEHPEKEQINGSLC